MTSELFKQCQLIFEEKLLGEKIFRKLLLSFKPFIQFIFHEKKVGGGDLVGDQWQTLTSGRTKNRTNAWIAIKH